MLVTALLFVALVLGSYRAWRLIGKDDITEPARAFVFGDATGWVRRYARDLVCCPWCAGTWVSIAVTYAVHRYATPLDPWLLWAAAVACLVGLLGDKVDA